MPITIPAMTPPDKNYNSAAFDVVSDTVDDVGETITDVAADTVAVFDIAKVFDATLNPLT
jgi:hypothetical protein